MSGQVLPRLAAFAPVAGRRASSKPWRRWAAVGLTAFAVLAVLALPPPPAAIEPLGLAGTAVRGAIHVHTTRSDGTGSIEEVAAAVARAGLAFVVFTDHGDGTRSPDPPQYRSGVLCLDGVEVSTADGHVLGLGLRQAPYPLAGEARDVVDDIHRLGGIAIAAHPGSPKPELQWRDWDAAIDGLEWLNTDSEWRDERWSSLARAFGGYLLRGPQAVAMLLDRPDAVLTRWDALITTRPVVSIAGADAHARLGMPWSNDPYDEGTLLEIPSYEATFLVFSNRAALDHPLTGDARSDAASILKAIGSGHVYTTMDALAPGGGLLFTAESGRRIAQSGDTLHVEGAARIKVRAEAPAGVRVVLLRRGEVVAESSGPSLDYEASEAPAAYRAEVRLARAPGTPPVPWLVSNPIYLERGPRATPHAPPAATDGRPLAELSLWRPELAPGSTLTIDGTVASTRITFALGGPVTHQYAAAATPVGGALAGYDRLTFTGTADKPTRISIQLRRPHLDERWRRSVYLDSTPRTITVFFDDFRPAGTTSRATPDRATIDSLLFVVDLTNTRAGTSGWIEVSGARLER
jgi:hypothetical protein